mmetsp:Transcript_16686/g.43228  ORF Transcript_16686/g.43228 Transcript_16686/m.43228 type:complete len:222 (+) Transcript_16686:149-814(+)
MRAALAKKSSRARRRVCRTKAAAGTRPASSWLASICSVSRSARSSASSSSSRTERPSAGRTSSSTDPGGGMRTAREVSAVPSSGVRAYVAAHSSARARVSATDSAIASAASCVRAHSPSRATMRAARSCSCWRSCRRARMRSSCSEARRVARRFASSVMYARRCVAISSSSCSPVFARCMTCCGACGLVGATPDDCGAATLAVGMRVAGVAVGEATATVGG